RFGNRAGQPSLFDIILRSRRAEEDRMRRLALAITLISAAFAAPPIVAQQATSGIFHRGLSASAIAPNSSFTVMFPVTAVGASSIHDCYYSCFITGGVNCTYSRTI